MKIAIALALAAALGTPALAQDIQPSDSRGIRTISGQGPLLLTFLAVKKTSTPLDDRTVIEFPASGLANIVSAHLVLGLSDLDPGPPAGTIDIYVYQGDGIVTAQEFFAGTFSTSFEYDATGVVEVDVTPALTQAVANGWWHIGFRLSTVTADRYFLGSIVGQPEPLLRIEGCYPDCNRDGILNLADFGCHQTAFPSGWPWADCNRDGVLNLADFGCFQTAYALGCP